MRKTGKERLAEKRASFEAIVNRYESPLLRYAARILRDHDAAQDVVQDAFVKLFRHWTDVHGPNTSLSTWLYRVTHNLAVDLIRKKQRLQRLHTRHGEEQTAMEPPRRGGEPGESPAAERARIALDALDLRERQLVLLKIFEEKSYREISEITGIGIGNVGYILHHAMKKMARQLRDSDQHENQARH